MAAPLPQRVAAPGRVRGKPVRPGTKMCRGSRVILPVLVASVCGTTFALYRRPALKPRPMAGNAPVPPSFAPRGGVRKGELASDTSLHAEMETMTSSQKYFRGISWYLMHFFISIFNDGMMKFLGSNIGVAQVVFVRFLLAAATLFVVLPFRGIGAFKTSRSVMHVARGSLLALGIGFWCWGLSMVPLAQCIVVNNTMPFWKMLFAKITLGERIGKERWLASLGGFIGCLIIFDPFGQAFDPRSLVLLLSAICFATLDVMNKKYADSESTVSMLFYGSVATCAWLAPKAFSNWTPLTLTQWGLFGLLGTGANLLLFCLLRAFRWVDASATCPYRYSEFLLSAVVGLFVFGEKPSPQLLLGSCIILPCVVYAAYVESRGSSEE